MKNKRENFQRIAEARTNKIIDTIYSLKNLSNTSYYEFTEEEIDQMFSAICLAAEEVKKQLLDEKKAKRRFKL
ncbi:MAG: hypothetical protein IJ194_06145 [Bacilli bacterium]|nr:hypothetical protein [Bacilli bacterium]